MRERALLFMIIVRLKGGLGNQLFQYAAARTLAYRRGVALRLDTTWFGGEENGKTDRRSYDLEAFRISASCASAEELARFGVGIASGLAPSRIRSLMRWFSGYRVWRNDEMGLIPEMSELGRDVYLEGYFQHPAHFSGMEDALRSEFIFARPLADEALVLARRLAAEASVCIQVRRTDFVADEAVARVHNVCESDYHKKAWGRFKSEVPAAKGYVFTDDAVWAQCYFEGWRDVQVVSAEMDGPAFLQRFALMRSCRHFILMNSTWGWWAAWLGVKPGGRVLLPEQWLRGRTTRELGLVCAGWEVVTGGRQ